MGLKGFSAADIDRLLVNVRQTGERATSAGLETMQEEGEKMAALARDYAPEDEGKLEAAIKSGPSDQGRDEAGRFTRKTVKVYVDESMPGSGGAANVGQYAWLMHEMLEPYGPMNLGERSREKNTSGQVGGKFLERAYKDRRSQALRAITIAVKNALKP